MYSISTRSAISLQRGINASASSRIATVTAPLLPSTSLSKASLRFFTSGPTSRKSTTRSSGKTARLFFSRGRPIMPSPAPPPQHQSRYACGSCGSCGCQSAAAPKNHRRTAYVALGSNLGDRVGWIEKACRKMEARGIRVTRTSSLWETEPMYVLEQDRFINGVCEVETNLEPLALLDELQDIERTLGRHKVIDKGPRNIDLDILLYEDEAVDHERLKIPHAGIAEREFVLRPLAELIPSKPIYPSKPWKFSLDYLHELPPNPQPLSALTPLSSTSQPITAHNPTRKTRVMAIVNITPDSFSDGGVHTSNSLPETLMSAVKAGVTMIDVGGQSSAPGRPEVTLEEELSRVIPTIKQIRSIPELLDVPISVDTYRAAVAEAAVEAGADVINDISAGVLDPEMLPTVARLGVTICMMHMRGDPRTMSKLNDYGNGSNGDGSASRGNGNEAGSEQGSGGIVPAIARELLDRVAAAEAAGIRRWRMILDPGLGFAKVGEQNLEVLSRLDELRSWPGLEGLPWLVGSSRKSFIGKVTGVTRAEDRVWGTAATVVAAVSGGADIVRVHDAVEMCQVVKMADAIYRRR